MKQVSIVAWLLFTLTPAFTAADHICLGSGPQTPRDISQKFGTNTSSFNLAPSYSDMNLCKIHTHTFAEPKGPGFSISANNGQTDGYRCNDTAGLSQEELTDPTHGVALIKASTRVIRLKCIGYIPLAPFSQVKDWALASAPLVRTPN